MAGKSGKLDRFIEETNKVMGAKGVTTLLGSLDKVMGVVTAAAGAAADVANHQLDEHHKRHQDDVVVPDISNLTLAQAKAVLGELDLRYALLAVAPSANLASHPAETVVRTQPRAKAKVPAGTFVKVFILGPDQLAESQTLADATAQRKQNRKDSAKALAGKVGHGTLAATTRVLKAGGNLTKKLTPTRKKKPQENPSRPRKIIDATVIEVPPTTPDAKPGDDV